MAEALSTQISLSRDTIRQNITDYIKNYLELENVDLTKSSFLSFLIDIISTLTANLMFYQISTYREFFLVTAQLPESILNLSAFLGYNTQEAVYATVNVLVRIPLSFTDASVTLTIPNNFKFKSTEGIEFLTYYNTTISITNNSSVSISVLEGSKSYTFPVTIDTENNEFVFILPLRQYKTTVQEFQIDSDTPLYQFVTIDVPFTGKISSLQVEVKNPGEPAFTIWTEFASLYLMDVNDKGYISRRTDDGRRIYFGNGLVGVQPTPGATIRVTITETEGAGGNVIAGSIIIGDRLYVTTGAGITQIVNYTVTNTSPATNGEDEESIEEIRSNAIAGLTTLGRLVTGDDYKNVDVVIPESPLATSALPVLKRSDLKVNEVQMFTVLQFGNSIVPTKNATYSTIPSTTYIPRGTTISVDDEDYTTLFDITTDLINQVANYHYILHEISQIPVLTTNYGTEYDIYSDNLIVSRQDDTGVFQLHYHSTEADADLTTCQLEVLSTGQLVDMTNDSTSYNFVYVFDPYTEIPEGEETFYFTISNATTTVARYSASFIFRQPLSDFMMSNLVATDSTSVVIYDIPTIKKSYYDSISQRDFEAQILQTMMTSMDFSGYRMLTDFTNLKFTNATGSLRNMRHNKVTRSPVIDIQPTPPTSPSLGDRYIVGDGTLSGSWIGYDDRIAQCTDASNIIWFFIEAATDDIVLVQNRGAKYIYTGEEWILIPTYQIPLVLEIEVFKELSYSGTIDLLAATVRTAVISAFESRFGINIELYRSEIIDVVQEVDGVDHCSVKKPETNVFFNFELEDLTEDELLEYGPEYVYFTTDSITVKVYT